MDWCIELHGKMNKDKILKLAKGFRGRSKNCIRVARERVEKSLQYAFRDRKAKKRDMRALWIQQINAGARQYGVRGDEEGAWGELGFLKHTALQSYAFGQVPTQTPAGALTG